MIIFIIVRIEGICHLSLSQINYIIYYIQIFSIKTNKETRLKSEKFEEIVSMMKYHL